MSAASRKMSQPRRFTNTRLYAWLWWFGTVLISLLGMVLWVFLSWSVVTTLLQPLLGGPLAAVPAVALAAAGLYIYARQQANPSFEATILIERPIADVFAFIATGYFENHPKWAISAGQDMEEPVSERTSTGPMAEGTKGRIVTRQGNKRYERHYSVTTYELNSRLTMTAHTVPSGSAFTLDYRFAPLPVGTEVTLAIHYRLRPIWGLFRYTWLPLWDRAWQSGSAAIKATAEHGIPTSD